MFTKFYKNKCAGSGNDPVAEGDGSGGGKAIRGQDSLGRYLLGGDGGGGCLNPKGTTNFLCIYI